MWLSRCLGRLAAAVLIFMMLPVGASMGEEYEGQYVWKVGTLAPRGVGWAKQVEQIVIPDLDEVTDSHLKLKVYWGGVMGDDEDVLKKMGIDQLQCAGLTAQGAFIACKEFSVLQLPFLFNNYDEVDYVRAKMLNVFDGFMQSHGFRLYMWIDQDFDQTYSLDKEMTSADDFKKLKFIKWNGQVEESLLLSLGASPIPVNVPEIGASMRQGVADGLIAPAIWMAGAQMHSVVRHVNPIKIRYSPAVIIVSTTAWDKVPDEHIQKAMSIREDLTSRFVAGTRLDNEKCLRAMIQYGVKESSTAPVHREEFMRLTRPVWNDLADDVYPRELLEEVTGHLEEFRTKEKTESQ